MILPIKKAFTLLELLIVISIIAILTTVSLKLNRWQIKDMEAMTDKEQWISRHRKYNTIITNTNFINTNKISSATWTYSWGNTSIWLAFSWDSNNENYIFKHHIISWNLQIIKKPLELSCTTVNGNDRIELIWPNKTSCFKLNTNLCSRTSCD